MHKVMEKCIYIFCPLLSTTISGCGLVVIFNFFEHLLFIIYFSCLCLFYLFIGLLLNLSDQFIP